MCGPPTPQQIINNSLERGRKVDRGNKVIAQGKLTLKEKEGFPGGAVVGNPPANAGDAGSSPGLGGSHMPRSN